jgi:hypothetical protein
MSTNKHSYNSVVFSSLSTHMYGVFQMRSDIKEMIEDGTFVPQKYLSYEYEMRDVYQAAFQRGTLEPLSNLDCINAYSQPYQSARSTVFLLPAANTTNLDKVEFIYPEVERTTGCGSESGNAWVFAQFQGASSCDWQDVNVQLPRLHANVSDWRPFGSVVEGCLSERAETRCKLQLSVHMLGIVVGFNVLKLVGILVAVRGIGEVPVLTVGDAIASFLRVPDGMTVGRGLLSQEEILRSKGRWRDQPPIKQLNTVHMRWTSTIKRRKLLTCLTA